MAELTSCEFLAYSYASGLTAMAIAFAMCKAGTIPHCRTIQEMTMYLHGYELDPFASSFDIQAEVDAMLFSPAPVPTVTVTAPSVTVTTVTTRTQTLHAPPPPPIMEQLEDDYPVLAAVLGALDAYLGPLLLSLVVLSSALAFALVKFIPSFTASTTSPDLSKMEKLCNMMLSKLEAVTANGKAPDPEMAGRFFRLEELIQEQSSHWAEVVGDLVKQAVLSELSQLFAQHSLVIDAKLEARCADSETRVKALVLEIGALGRLHANIEARIVSHAKAVTAQGIEDQQRVVRAWATRVAQDLSETSGALMSKFEASQERQIASLSATIKSSVTEVAGDMSKTSASLVKRLEDHSGSLADRMQIDSKAFLESHEAISSKPTAPGILQLASADLEAALQVLWSAISGRIDEVLKQGNSGFSAVDGRINKLEERQRVLENFKKTLDRLDRRFSRQRASVAAPAAATATAPAGQQLPLGSSQFTNPVLDQILADFLENNALTAPDLQTMVSELPAQMGKLSVADAGSEETAPPSQLTVPQMVAAIPPAESADPVQEDAWVEQFTAYSEYALGEDGIPMMPELPPEGGESLLRTGLTPPPGGWGEQSDEEEDVVR